MTKQIELTQGMVAVVDDADFEWLNQWKWCVARYGNHAYAEHSIRLPSGKQAAEKMHRLILNAPKGMEVDHIDRDGLNNQRSNLRLATRSQNAINILAGKGVSKFRGVTLDKRSGNWRSGIRINQKYIWLGAYKTEIDAARAYDAGALQYHGEYAQLNFP